jgi:hypothetical protein
MSFGGIESQLMPTPEKFNEHLLISMPDLSTWILPIRGDCESEDRCENTKARNEMKTEIVILRVQIKNACPRSVVRRSCQQGGTAGYIC